MTYQSIINIVGECDIKELDGGITIIDIKNPKMDKLLMLYDYCFYNLESIYKIITNQDDKLKYVDFIHYKLNLEANSVTQHKEGI